MKQNTISVAYLLFVTYAAMPNVALQKEQVTMKHCVFTLQTQFHGMMLTELRVYITPQELKRQTQVVFTSPLYVNFRTLSHHLRIYTQKHTNLLLTLQILLHE